MQAVRQPRAAPLGQYRLRLRLCLCQPLRQCMWCHQSQLLHLLLFGQSQDYETKCMLQVTPTIWGVAHSGAQQRPYLPPCSLNVCASESTWVPEHHNPQSRVMLTLACSSAMLSRHAWPALSTASWQPCPSAVRAACNCCILCLALCMLIYACTLHLLRLGSPSRLRSIRPLKHVRERGQHTTTASVNSI